MIGVFDSGLGGLTVLEELVARHPGLPFVYLGDQANAPYGGESPERVYELTERSVDRLFRMGCELVILACNTASTVALRRLQEGWLPQRWPRRRVLGIVVPTIEALTGRPWHAPQNPSGGVERARTVAIFATPATVESGYFATEIARRDPTVQIIQQACSRLAGLIEEAADSPALSSEIRLAVDSLRVRLAGRALDRVLLGCTHYALVQDLFARIIAQRCDLISQPRETAAALARYLHQHPEFRLGAPSNEPPLLLTTGDPKQASARATRFLGRRLRFEAVPPAGA